MLRDDLIKKQTKKLNKQAKNLLLGLPELIRMTADIKVLIDQKTKFVREQNYEPAANTRDKELRAQEILDSLESKFYKTAKKILESSLLLSIRPKVVMTLVSEIKAKHVELCIKLLNDGNNPRSVEMNLLKIVQKVEAVGSEILKTVK